MPALAYPAALKISDLTNSQLAVKIARHSECEICDNCNGFHPAPDVDVVLDGGASPDALELFNDEEEPSAPYLESCSCGHGIPSHGAHEPTLGRDEFVRRSKVAVRLDEFLQVRIRITFFVPSSHCYGAVP
jgi:histone acetyltransferase